MTLVHSTEHADRTLTAFNTAVAFVHVQAVVQMAASGNVSGKLYFESLRKRGGYSQLVA